MIYNFSIRDAHGGLPEAVGCMMLPNYDAAREFGNAVVWDMLFGNSDPHFDCTMSVVENERVVCCTPIFEVKRKCPAG
ncbi:MULTISPECIES: hypothetical protein [Bradyrhizobium]|jgi:hypothetical protein|uniref:hypothetical protein n=1 Tax=Bradyrhizobium TaxID=374 RepID=UPI00230631E4|nr:MULTISPECIES: hypothetical protein [Bradyrhizobium]MDA9411838.1 hypothetical protein [Bradyrhizobium sp. CCBAU 45384]WLB24404.1 hypothetical protein QIH95_48665 [Bradyrhizobium japonicum]